MAFESASRVMALNSRGQMITLFSRSRRMPAFSITPPSNARLAADHSPSGTFCSQFT